LALSATKGGRKEEKPPFPSVINPEREAAPVREGRKDRNFLSEGVRPRTSGGGEGSYSLPKEEDTLSFIVK